MKSFILVCALSFSVLAFGQNNFFDLSALTIDGEVFEFAELKGQKVMIVNTASECGLTPQYEALEKLFQQYGGDDFIILGFPANDFLKQEPGSDEEIKSFCFKNYGVTFQMMSKITVKGDDMHPVYEWLTQKQLNGVEDSKVKWNFQKYLIDEEGVLVKVISPKTDPMDDTILEFLTN